MKEHVGEGHQQGENEPDVHQLEAGCLGQRVHVANEQRGQDEQGAQVHGHLGLKELWLEKFKTVIVIILTENPKIKLNSSIIIEKSNMRKDL